MYNELQNRNLIGTLTQKFKTNSKTGTKKDNLKNEKTRKLKGTEKPELKKGTLTSELKSLTL